MLPIVLTRVLLSFTNWGQWRRKCSVDSTSWPQPHSGFIVLWKLYLNLYSHKSLIPNQRLVMVLRQLFRVMAIINRIWSWSYEFQDIDFKNLVLDKMKKLMRKLTFCEKFVNLLNF